MNTTRPGTTAALFALVLLAATAVSADPSRNRGMATSGSASTLAAMTAGGGTELSDATVTALVKSKLATNANTRDLPVLVDTRNGVVRLRGEVWSAEERELVELLARSTTPAMVQNDLVVRDRKIASR